MEVYESVEIRGKRERIDADIGKPGWGGSGLFFSRVQNLSMERSQKRFRRIVFRSAGEKGIGQSNLLSSFAPKYGKKTSGIHARV